MYQFPCSVTLQSVLVIIPFCCENQFCEPLQRWLQFHGLVFYMACFLHPSPQFSSFFFFSQSQNNTLFEHKIPICLILYSFQHFQFISFSIFMMAGNRSKDAAYELITDSAIPSSVGQNIVDFFDHHMDILHNADTVPSLPTSMLNCKLLS